LAALIRFSGGEGNNGMCKSVTYCIYCGGMTKRRKEEGQQAKLASAGLCRLNRKVSRLETQSNLVSPVLECQNGSGETRGIT